MIERVRKVLPRGTRLLVNPTSGTKQMSVGAALAALDADAGELVFTVGERADGVVKTGTEKLESFDAAEYVAERDRRMAMRLAKAGAFSAAATLLSRHESLAEDAETARCLHEWERQNYWEARCIAARSSSPALLPVRAQLESLANARKATGPQPVIIADLLQTADQFHRRRDFESALVLACRAVEMGLRRALFEKTDLNEPYSLSKLCALSIDQGVKDRCRHNSHDGRHTILNLRAVASILQQLGHDLGEDFFMDRELQSLIRGRNELMHEIRSVTEAESQAAVQRARNLLTPLALPEAMPRPTFC